MDSLDVRLLDDELQAEIQMVAELIEAANLSEGPLAPWCVDAVLGLGAAASPPSVATAKEQAAFDVDSSRGGTSRRRPRRMATPA